MAVKKKSRALLPIAITSASTALGGVWLIIDKQHQFDDAVLRALQQSATTMREQPIYSKEEIAAMDEYARQVKENSAALATLNKKIIEDKIDITKPQPALDREANKILREGMALGNQQAAVHKVEWLAAALANFKQEQGITFPVEIMIAGEGDSAQVLGMRNPSKDPNAPKHIMAILSFTPQFLKNATAKELEFMANHELSHIRDAKGADGNIAIPSPAIELETKADKFAIQRTCNLPSATSALAKVGAVYDKKDIATMAKDIEQRRNSLAASLKEGLLTRPPSDASHPHWTVRVKNVQEEYKASCKGQ